MIRQLQTNFTGGAISADARERLDLAVWKNSVSAAENVRIRPQGGASRRPGFAAVDNNPGNGWSTGSTMQVEPFIFNADQQYVFCFGGGVVNAYYRNTRTLLQQIALPYPAYVIDQNELSIVQSYDKMICFHKDFPINVITRNDNGLFITSELQWSAFNDGLVNVQRPPFHKYAAPHVAMWTDGPTNNPDVGWCNVFVSDPVFVGAHYHTWLLLRGVYLYVVGVLNQYQCLCVMIGSLANWETHSTEWQEQAFSGARGYPRCGVKHEQRLWLAGGRDLPNTIFGSTTYDPFNFYLGTGQATDAIKYTADADRVAEIRRMVSYNHLQVFTADGEFYAPSPDSNAITPATMSLKQQSPYGIARAPAVRFDQTTIFISRTAGSIREFVYDGIQGSYSSDALTFMAKDYIRGPLDIDVASETDFAQEMLAIVTNSDGTLAILSKVRKENVGAWMLWKTDGIIRRVGVVQREIWAVVDRTINGVATRGLEVMDANYMLDFAAGYTASGGVPTVSWSFPKHAGMTVHVRSGDLYLGQMVVGSGGALTLPVAVASCEVGLMFEPLIAPLVQEVQMPDGSSWGQPKRVISTTAAMVATTGLQIDGAVLPHGNASQDPGIAPDRFTGKFKAWRLGWGTAEAPRVTGKYPLPWHLTAISTEVEV